MSGKIGLTKISKATSRGFLCDSSQQSKITSLRDFAHSIRTYKIGPQCVHVWLTSCCCCSIELPVIEKLKMDQKVTIEINDNGEKSGEALVFFFGVDC